MDLSKQQIDLSVGGVDLHIAALQRLGDDAPMVFLHGFGSTKEDYADLACHPDWKGRRLIAYDAPGCGATECSDLSALSIPFLKNVALSVLDHLKVDRFHLAGHSMGGLTALVLAREVPERVLSFTNIEGNVAPEDCFLSRQILEFPADDPAAFMDAFADRAWTSGTYSGPLFAAALHHKVRALAVAPIFRSMVALSDAEPLFDDFTGLPCPKMFVYGDRNRHLSYLGKLLELGVQLAEIEQSDHWPMYANPVALWSRMGAFIGQVEIDRITPTLGGSS